MERTELNGKDVIVHKDMTPESREKELKRLKRMGRVNTTSQKWPVVFLYSERSVFNEKRKSMG